MRMQSEFKNIHTGKQIICIGNGPGLKNIPFSFVESKINIGLNYILEWVPFLKINYWLTLDKECLDAMPDEIPSFAPLRYMTMIDKKNYIPLILDEQVEGIPFSKTYGAGYTTSLAAAGQLAIFMGAKTVFFVGFDCTFPGEPLTDQVKGISNLPHFYSDEIEGEYMPQWDYEMSCLRSLARKKGVALLNLSNPTKAQSLLITSYRKFWRPNAD